MDTKTTGRFLLAGYVQNALVTITVFHHLDVFDEVRKLVKHHTEYLLFDVHVVIKGQLCRYIRDHTNRIKNSELYVGMLLLSKGNMLSEITA